MLQNKLQSCGSIRLTLFCLLAIAIILLMITTPAAAEAENIVVAVYPQPSHTFVLTADGSLWAWGSNSYGKLGDGTTLDRSIPTQLILEDVAALYPQSSGHTFALKNDGSLWAWERNWDGRIGTGSVESDHTAPVEILRDVALLFPHERHSFALKNDGTLWAWGNNSYGQLGDGTTVNRFAPVEINLENVVTVVPNANNSFAIQSDGSLWAWGHNQYGKLGDGATANRYSPVKVLDAVDAVFPGETHTLALKSDKTMWAWGYNWYGQLGYGGIDNQSQPVQIPIDGVAEVFPQKYHTFALKDDGTLWAWGYNWYGQLGDGSISNRNSPVQIPVDGVANIYPREYHTFMLKDDQTLWGWGRNWDNRLGDASNAHVRSAPVLISSEVQEAYILEKHAFAIDKDGSLLAWGNNNKAQLGNGSDAEALIPESIALENIAEIYAQDEHTFALKEDGSLWAWGSNANGQLGIGSFQRQSTPVQVVLDDDLLTHIVSLSSEPLGGGTLDGGGTYRDGENVTVNVTANPGYTFVNWTENNQVMGTNTNLSFLVLADRYLVANFKADEEIVADEEEVTIYTIKLNSSPAEGGTVTGEGSYASESEATVKAAANEGYSFIRWSEKDEEISTEAELSFIVLSDRELTAIFEVIAEEEPETYLLTLSANPSDSGTVEGGDDYEEAAEVSINATPAEGYEFVNWTLGVDGDQLSAEATYTYTMPAEAITLVANFEAVIAEPETYALELLAEPAEGGSVGGGGDYEEAAEVLITAIPTESYEFVNWTLGVDGDQLSAEATYTYTMPAEAITLVANFEAVIAEPETYALELLAEPAEGGSVGGGGDYEEAAEVLITAIPTEGYEFVNWTLGVDGDQLSAEATYTYTMPAEAVTLVANFEAVIAEPETYALELLAEPEEGGTVEGGDDYEEAAEVSINATPAEGYEFVNWTLGTDGDELSNDVKFDYVMPAKHVTLFANFKVEEEKVVEYAIKLNASPAEGGTVTGEGSYAAESEATVKATANEGYSFIRWSENDKEISTKEELSFNVLSDRELTAIFEIIAEEEPEPYSLTVMVLPSNSGNVKIDGEDVEDGESKGYKAGDTVHLTAFPADGHEFVNWTLGVDGDQLSAEATYTYTMSAEAVTLVANFDNAVAEDVIEEEKEVKKLVVNPETSDYQPIFYYLEVDFEPAGGGEVDGEGFYEQGETAVVIAKPDPGYNFYGWHENGSMVSFDARFEFTVEREQLLTAVFETQGKAEIFDIILHSTPQGDGTVQGEGIYASTETALVVAIPETQYQFDSWTENGDIVSTEAEYQFIITDSRELTATFSLISQHETGDGGLSQAKPAKPEEIEEPAPIEETEEETYAIILIVEPKEGGLVSGDGNYLADDIVGLDATPAEGYAFSGWHEHGEEVSMAKAYAFTVDRERTLTATFSPLLSRQNEFAETYRISLAPQPLDGGRVYGGGEYTEGETITINALPNMDFYFQNWTENGIEVSSEIIYTFKVERDVKLAANFISLFGNNYNNSGSYSAADDFERFLESYFADFLVPTLSPTEPGSLTLSLYGWTNSLLAPMGGDSVD